MTNPADLDTAREIASQLSGSLDLLANIHATVAVRDPEARPLASTFALLHEHAEKLKQSLS